jgi:competence protein ComGC
MTKKRNAHTLLELIIIVVVMAAATLAVIAVSRMSGSSATTKSMACQNNIATMNTQIEVYYSENGSWPLVLTDVTNDPNYFPKGAPACPTGGRYSMSRATHRVSCSTHGH